QRNPPPALFLHPSPAASHVSLVSTAVAGPGSVSTGVSSSQATTGLSAGTAPAPRRGILPPLQTGPAPYARRESTRATDRTDALWAEMQATLEEVELSASGGTRVFGPDHDRKLAELRAAQIELAQAWARSEADEAIETASSAAAAAAATAAASASTGTAGVGGELRTDGTGATADGGVRSAATGTASIRPGSAGTGAEKLGRKLDEETESDIRRARERRKANDRYFQRVNQGVLDVIAKLDGVATAMRAVEQESKDVWGDESVPSSAR
ncbi:hypothetical protein M406DRAFT_18578, partial [Cryphonectria parasitica EP155]